MAEQMPDPSATIETVIVAASRDDAGLIVRAAEKDGLRLRWDCVDCEAAFVARLAQQKLPEMIVAKSRLPRFSALEGLALLKKQRLDIPLIVVADELAEDAVDCLRQGAADSLTSDRLDRLPAAILHALEQKRLRDQHEQLFAELVESEERYRSLVEDAPDAILVIRDERIVYTNDAGLRLLGAKGRQQLIGRDFLEFVHRDYHPILRQRSKQILTHHQPSALAEMQLIRLDGEVTDVEVLGMPCSFGGKPAIQRVLRDVGDRRRAQERAREHLAELAHVTRLRMMGELMSEVSHEINQPLYAISNFAEASLNRLRSGAVDLKEILVWLEQIAVQANRAGEIIRRIGRFVRKSPARMTDTAINEIVRDVVDLLGVDGRLDAVDLDLQLSPNLPPVKVDRIQIEQVLVNLLRNALEAMADNPSASRRLSVRTEWAPSGAIRVAVRDNGRGLTSDELKRLFEPFFTTKAEGMGMGLSISHSIIEAHGGRMEAVANSDRGLTFQFTLPVSKQETSHGE